MSELIAFYLGQSPDNRGRFISDIWAYNHVQLEQVHDFIQWLFPAYEPSMFNPSAPILTQQDISEFKNNTVLRDAVKRSFALMTNFYGFAFSEDALRKAEKSSMLWITPGNHNFLRITRILKFLVAIDMRKLALQFFD